MKIVLDAVEEKVCSILLQFSKEFALTGNPAVTLRFTGGWVRDKLLGRTSHDIDVAIDKSTGEEFATGLHNYMVGKNLAETNVHKVAVNPEKSKHLETAMTRICGLDIDFVNLRSEEYASDSRVPSKITFGTPEEDAFRRDATLNALFYNLTTDTVEDFTGRGLEDLKNGVLRTPLDPTETFRDDPLRVLRLLRFVGQLGFTVAPNTYAAMRGNLVGSSIQSKVSGERVGKEIEKMLSSGHSVKAMQSLVDLDLARYVFSHQAESPKDHSISTSRDQLATRLTSMEWLIPQLTDSLSAENKSILWLASLLQDLPEEDVGIITQAGLKMTRLVKDGCLKLVRSAQLFDHLCELYQADQLRRVDAGLYVRNCGALWPLTIKFNAARLHSLKKDVTLAAKIERTIIGQGLEKAYELKPLIAGKELMTLLSLKPGPGIKKILDSELEFQLQNPSIDKNDMIEWLKEQL